MCIKIWLSSHTILEATKKNFPRFNSNKINIYTFLFMATPNFQKMRELLTETTKQKKQKKKIIIKRKKRTTSKICNLNLNFKIQTMQNKPYTKFICKKINKTEQNQKKSLS